MTTEHDEPMDERLERLEALAALAAGELDDAERAELERQVAADPALAAELARIRAADALLASLLDEPVPSSAHDRLMAALAPVLDDQLAEPDSPTLRDRLLGWLPSGPLVPRLAAAAAAVVVVAGVGVGLSQLGERTGQTAALSEATLEDGEGAGGQAADAPMLFEGVTGGDYDEASALELLDAYATEARSLGSAPGAEAGDDLVAEPGDPEVDAAQPPPDEDLAFARIEACLDKPYESEDGTTLHAEAATYNDEPAIVYVVQREDGTVELWVVGQAECGVLLFREAGTTAEDS